MYKWFGSIAVITVNEWLKAGLTHRQLKYDCQRGYATLYRRSRNGNSLINVSAITRPDRLDKLEALYGRLESIEEKQDRIIAEQKYFGAQLAELNRTLVAVLENNSKIMEALATGGFVKKSRQEESLFDVPVFDPAARQYFLAFRTTKGLPLKAEIIEKYVNRAAILEACRVALNTHAQALVINQKRPVMGKFYENCVTYYLEQAVMLPCDVISNKIAFSRVFNAYLREGYKSVVHRGIDNKNAVATTDTGRKVMVSLHNDENTPFVKRTEETFNDFLDGKIELFDRETGEILKPEAAVKPGKTKVSTTTVYNTVKSARGVAATVKKRRGYFKSVNDYAPKNRRLHGNFSLSKITMDDVTFSMRVSGTDGRVKEANSYVYTDVVSEYRFQPAYILGKPDANTVGKAYRNMMRELIELGLPKPCEADSESHIIKDLAWWTEAWQVTTINKSATSKRQEHFNRYYKYFDQKDAGHMVPRFYGKNAYEGQRKKIKGEFMQRECTFEQILIWDAQDTARHNNSLHSDQKKFPGKTRKQVLVECYNREQCQPWQPWFDFRLACLPTATSIRKCNEIQAHNEFFWLRDIKNLEKLKPNRYDVNAYFLPDKDNKVDAIYLYQDDTYIGEALNMMDKRYNECKVEQTDRDKENFLWQQKQTAKFWGWQRAAEKELLKLGKMTAETSQAIADVKVETVPPQPPDRDLLEEILAEYRNDPGISKTDAISAL
jgi:hypothetical protein